MNLEVTAITVLLTRGADRLSLETTLPCGTWPFEGTAYITLEVAAEAGEKYATTHFPGVPVKVIDTQ